MRKFTALAAATAALICIAGQGAVAQEGTVMWPDVNGKMVRIPIAYTMAQCLKNGRNLGYPEATSKDWCTQHCDGKICK
jgi:hypothetical protein